ncbi:hypothetical protein FALCPG4_018724 [Fusarium falciforme]
MFDGVNGDEVNVEIDIQLGQDSVRRVTLDEVHGSNVQSGDQGIDGCTAQDAGADDDGVFIAQVAVSSDMSKSR